ncbi:hypothetical protein G7Y89_g14294 [Cudoniella acicularis]|uniref:2EXR domain-containing protein n=1 Tax=Cudoniella acicularis TaxID=354080 RepID=A0A8H4R5L5_9HELO|nr:hypothetical protein G7Y89_g14294 [Cudoniella acicularis]
MATPAADFASLSMRETDCSDHCSDESDLIKVNKKIRDFAAGVSPYQKVLSGDITTTTLANTVQADQTILQLDHLIAQTSNLIKELESYLSGCARQHTFDQLAESIQNRSILMGRLLRAHINKNLTKESRLEIIKDLEVNKTSLEVDERDLLSVETQFRGTVASHNLLCSVVKEMSWRQEFDRSRGQATDLKIVTEYPYFSKFIFRFGGLKLPVRRKRKQNHSSSPPKASFSLFSGLPTELRLVIWDFALPEGRILTQHPRHNKALPFLAVCGESRDHTRQKYPPMLLLPPTYQLMLDSLLTLSKPQPAILYNLTLISNAQLKPRVLEDQHIYNNQDTQRLHLIELDSNLSDYVSFRWQQVPKSITKMPIFRDVPGSCHIQILILRARECRMLFHGFLTQYPTGWNPELNVRLLAYQDPLTKCWMSRDQRFLCQRHAGPHVTVRSDDGGFYYDFLGSIFLARPDGGLFSRYDGMAEMFESAETVD